MILVDPRVGSKELFSDIFARVSGKAQLAKPQLAGGDFAFEGNGPNGRIDIGIERKCIGDMLGSMRSGRYAGDQAITMSSMYDVCYLIVEGIFRPNVNGYLETPKRGKGPVRWVPFTLAAKGPMSRKGFTYAELDKFLQSLELKKNVIVVRSSSKMETVWQIVNRYNWWQKEWDAHESTDPIKTQTEITFSRVTEDVLAVAAWPGIGLKRSKAILRHFGSIENAVNALPTEWREIEGIGEQMSVRLYGFFRKHHGGR